MLNNLRSEGGGPGAWSNRCQQMARSVGRAVQWATQYAPRAGMDLGLAVAADRGRGDRDPRGAGARGRPRAPRACPGRVLLRGCLPGVAVPGGAGVSGGVADDAGVPPSRYVARPVSPAVLLRGGADDRSGAVRSGPGAPPDPRDLA